MRFSQRAGFWNITTGGTSGTPVLEMLNITRGNTLRVTASFNIKLSTNSSGVVFSINPTKPQDAKALTSESAQVSGNDGWQTVSKTTIFEAVIDSPTGVEEIDFQVIFENGEFDGAGELSNFLLQGQVVTITEP